MTVCIGDVTFSDWIGIEHEGSYTDTFIFHIDAMHGLPPFGYYPLLKRLAAKLRKKRSGASLWIRVDAPGEWYAAAVKRSMLRGFPVQYVVTRAGATPGFRSFSFRPQVFHPAMKDPPEVADGFSDMPPQALKCLQVLGRIRKGDDVEIASLTGLSTNAVMEVLHGLEQKRLTEFKHGTKIQDKTKPVEPDPYPLWHPTRKGLSIALRSWGASKGVQFSRFKEMNPGKICTPHRNLSRRWLAWLKCAYPRAEIWSGWSESRLPGMSVYPDALAWGRVQGYEALFWLEVGDEHKSEKKIQEITKIRLASALKFCRETGVRLVYAQISQNWVQKAAGWALSPLPEDAAVVMEDWRRFGKLPTVEWGKITN
jgi:hypothetical protein